MLKTLVLCDDCWHPAETVLRAFKNVPSGRYELDYVTAPRDILSKRMLREYDVVICDRADSFSPALRDSKWFDPKWCEVMPADFEEYVSLGRGFVSLHAGNSLRKSDSPDMCAFIGNEFLFHPPQCPVTVRPSKPHPITEGVKPFTVRDEHYVIKLLCDDADVFLESSSETEAGTQIAGYTRSIGRGRLCALTPGHTYSALSEPEYLKLIFNAVDWCAGLR